jgi:hypothetical protein
MKKLSIKICLMVVLSAGSAVTMADTTEVDAFGHSWAQIELQDPGGLTEIINLSGPSTIEVFFEGPSEGIADDNDLDGLDEVSAEIVAMNLTGASSSLGPVELRLLSGGPQSLGEIEETVNNTPGVLDLPPFTVMGAANSFFDVHIELYFSSLGRVLYPHPLTPSRLSALIHEKPPAHGDIYQDSSAIPLFSENGDPTGYALTNFRYKPNPVVEVDAFDYSCVRIEITDPMGITETVELTGSSEMAVFFEGLPEGTAYDDDPDGLDEVDAKIVDMNLAGVSDLFGAVELRLCPAIPQPLGEIEETSNNTAGMLDLPPFTATGTASSFFDVYIELSVEVLGQLYPETPSRLFALINEKPPAHGDVYQDSSTIYLLDDQGIQTGFRLDLFRYGPTCGDWGDAPDGANPTRYPTLAANNGASHAIVDGLMLGGAVDAELDGQPTNIAAGDDKDGNDDEDGVVFVTWPLVPGRGAVVEVTASGNGLLYAWIDFNGDDSWAQVKDQIFDAQPLTPGINSLVFQVPMTATGDITTFGRFRFTSDASVGYDGPASDGEVEDHIVKIKQRCGIKWVQSPDETENGIDISVCNVNKTVRTLADDFRCTSFDLITDVHLWCSWLGDIKGNITNIHLAIYSDDPIGAGGSDPSNTYSKPDLLRWETDFGPGEFAEQLHATIQPGQFWWDPEEAVLTSEADNQIWRIDLYIDRTKAFFQEGTAEVPAVYWLAVQVEVDAGSGEFGWKTRRWPHHYNDNAVRAVGTAQPLSWKEMIYPNGHPYEGQPLDMAFIITTEDYCPARGDLNCDGLINFLDFSIFAAQWLQTIP